MKFCKALHGSLNIERDRVHYCYIVKQHMPSIPWNPDEDLPIDRIQLVRKALLRHLNEDMDQMVPEYETFGENSMGVHPCKGCRDIIEIDDGEEIPDCDQLVDYLHMQAFTYCNAKCIYCELSQTEGRTPLKRGKNLDRAVYKAVNQLIDNELVSPDCRVIFSSGEPTLSKSGVETLKRLVHRGQNILVNTNAIKFSPELEWAMQKGNTDVQVSLDSGDRQSYIKIKGVDQFDAVAENIDRYVAAASEKSKFWLKYIVFSKTTSKEMLDHFIDFCSVHHIGNVVVNVNYNEGEVVDSKTHVEIKGAPDMSTLRAFGYLASKLELMGIRVAVEFAHLTVREKELAKHEYEKAMKAELLPFQVLADEKPLKSVTVMHLTTNSGLFKDISISENSPFTNHEITVINMLPALKKIGLDVTITSSLEDLKDHKCDIFIACQKWDIFQNKVLPGKVNYLWSLDDTNKNEFGMLQHSETAKGVFNVCDGVIFSSHYQQQRWLKNLKLPYDKAFLSRCGIPIDKFHVLPEDLKNRSPWAYLPCTSRNDLVLMLKGWALIKLAAPEAKLHLFISKEMNKDSEKELFRQLCRVAKSLDGVNLHDSVGQNQLIQTAQVCRVLASPCASPKINCIRELEAMAAGDVVVSMALGALPEMAWCNPLVPMVNGWLKRWVSEVVRVLVDDDHYLRLAQQNLNIASYFSCDTVAKNWLERFQSDWGRKKS